MKAQLVYLHYHFTLGLKDDEMFNELLDKVLKGLTLLQLNWIKEHTSYWKEKQLMKINFEILLIIRSWDQNFQRLHLRL